MGALIAPEPRSRTQSRSGLWLATCILLAACNCGGRSSIPQSHEEIPAKLTTGRPSDAGVKESARELAPVSQASSRGVGQPGPQQCHALEWQKAIERTSRPYVLIATANDLGDLAKDELAVRVARRAVKVADTEGTRSTQAEARLAYGTALSARAHLMKTSLLPGLSALRDALRLSRLAAAAGNAGGDARVVGVLVMLARANRSHGANAVALETYREALRVARKVDAKDPGCRSLVASVGELLRSWCDESYKPACELLVHAGSADYEASRRMQKEGCGAGKSKVNTKPIGRRWTAALEALELAKEKDLKEAETFARIEVELSEGMWDPLDNVEAHLVLAHVLSLQGKHKSAMAELDKALQQTERREFAGQKLRPGGELRAHVLLHIAAAKRMAGGVELERAKSALQSALKLCDISGEDGAKEYLRRSCAEGCPAACSLASD